MADYLDLPTDCLTAPTRWDLAVIEARMIWPHNSDRRERYLSAVSVKVAVMAIDRVPLPKPSWTEVRDLAEAILSAPRIEDFTEAGKRAYYHGLVAGMVLDEAVGLHDIGRENTGLAGIKSAVATRLGPEQRLSQKTIDNTVWPSYRSVVHFWAAYLQRSQETDSATFPCRGRDLSLFLAVAEVYRRRGETIRSTPKSPSTVLRPGDAVMIPPALALPEVELIFSTKN